MFHSLVRESAFSLISKMNGGAEVFTSSFMQSRSSKKPAQILETYSQEAHRFYSMGGSSHSLINDAFIRMYLSLKSKSPNLCTFKRLKTSPFYLPPLSFCRSKTFSAITVLMGRVSGVLIGQKA
jgi:hypothetical protein